jgi:hypothetical protein
MDGVSDILFTKATSHPLVSLLTTWFIVCKHDISSIDSLFQPLYISLSWSDRIIWSSRRDTGTTILLVLPVFSRIFQYMQYWYYQYFPESSSICNTGITSIFQNLPVSAILVLPVFPRIFRSEWVLVLFMNIPPFRISVSRLIPFEIKMFG